MYPLSSYAFGSKAAREEKGTELGAQGQPVRELREAQYEQEGMRRSVQGVLIVCEHGHPHVLLLQSVRTHSGCSMVGALLCGRCCRCCVCAVCR
jgi:cleavage and polyadenylation specificity factor subunit 5